MPIEVANVKSLPLIRFPIQVTEIPGAKEATTSFYCRCGAPADQIRGRTIEYSRCLELRGAYVCFSCRSVYPLSMRWYFLRNGEVDHLLVKQPRGWVDIPARKKPWFKMLASFLPWNQ